jgi:hypothetical protein
MKTFRTKLPIINRYLLAAFLLLASQAPAAAAEDGIRGYDIREGYIYIAFGSFPQERESETQPILWRVLTVQDGSACMLSEQILEARPVHNDSGHYPGWAASDLNRYLNNEFRKAAFTQAERYALTAKESGTVTLPAVEDLKNEGYGFVSPFSRQAQSTAFAKAGGLYDYWGAKHFSPYWTSTPALRPDAQRRVMLDGALGFYAVDAKDIGVRPLIWLDLGKAAAAGGSGTISDPYILAIDMAGMPAEAEETPAPSPVPAETAAPLPDKTAAVEAAETPTPTNTRRSGRDFPPLNVQGFLDTGEYIYENANDGLWQYASTSLRLIIRRYEDPAIPLRWYEAEIFTAENETFKILRNNKDDPNAAANPADIAKTYQAVYAQNTDGHTQRVNTITHHAYAGIIIRDGEILYNDPPPAEWTLFPNLDLLALLHGGEMKVYHSGENSAPWYIASGARDVLSYGPCLVQSGTISPQAAGYGVTFQARSGIGISEAGHFFGIVAEGRTDRSTGENAAWMAKRFLELGCITAFNLEGGSAAAMVFLGKQINETGRYAGSTLPMAQNEALCIGTSN